MTHGGLGSLVEAIYHKAVIVGVPLRLVADADNIILLNLFVIRESSMISLLNLS